MMGMLPGVVMNPGSEDLSCSLQVTPDSLRICGLNELHTADPSRLSLLT